MAIDGKMNMVILAGVLLINLTVYQAGLQVEKPNNSSQLDTYQLNGGSSTGSPKEAPVDFEERLPMLHDGRSSLRQRLGLIRFAIHKWNLGDIDDSSRNFKRAMTSAAKIGDKKTEAFCSKCLNIIRLYALGKDDRKAEYYFRSLLRFDQAIILGREIAFPEFEVKCLRQKGQTYLDMHRPEAYLDCNKRGFEISALIGNNVEKGRFLNNIGIYYQGQNEFSLAVTYFESGLTEAKGSGDSPTEAECLNNLGMSYRELGNHSRALYYLESALELDRKAGEIEKITMDLANLGNVYVRKGMNNHNREDLMSGLKFFQECISLQGGKRSGQAISISALNNIGVIQNELGEHESARLSFYSAMRLIKKKNLLREECYVLNNIGISYLYENNIKKALESFQTSYDNGLKRSYENSLMESCLGIGRCYDLIQQRASALQYYKKAIGIFESIRSHITSEPFLMGFAGNRLSTYHRAIKILAGQYSVNKSSVLLEEIFNLIERVKARAFLEGLNGTQETFLNRARPDLSDKLASLSKSISWLDESISDEKTSPEERARLYKLLEWEEEEYYRLATERIVISKDIPSEIDKETCSIKEIQKDMEGVRAVLLEYFMGEDECYLILISPEKAMLFVLGQKAELEKSLRAYIRVLADESFPSGTINNVGERLGEELIPYESRGDLNQVEDMIIIPDGALYYLPFETLRLGGTRDTSYLAERKRVSYCYSASAFLWLKQKGESKDNRMELLAIGGPAYKRNGSALHDYRNIKEMRSQESHAIKSIELSELPHSRREVGDISKLFPKNKTRILVGEEATEEIIKHVSLKDYRIVHFACHGVVDFSYPLRSALVLSAKGSTKEDGLLQLREVYGLVMNADLVVLSACQTGTGILERAEGLIGLARPFFFAGARSVISTLWPIKDKAARAFMLTFYDEFVCGNSIGESLRFAKIKMIRSSWSHPSYWAGFMLNGNPFIRNEN